MRICRILVLSTCVWVPLAGSAQNVRDTIQVDSAIVSTGYDLAGITVRVARPVLTTGGASAVILELDSLGALPAPSMEEVLRAMPLIVVRQNSRGESQPTLRGSEERQIGVFLDGVPITIGWDHRSDMSIVPMTGAQSVRVVRGSSSVLHGPNTIGGVIEVDIARGPSRPLPEAPVSIALSLDETGGTSLSAATARSIEVGNANLIVRAGAGHQTNKGVPLPSAAS
ncbi:MAG: TonB-dependent receptor plug domain-containing protein, partial [Gemmatimonadetes bacterium]|nr:TonB-dependent receptor plug domain-containing protein [Gemmatimonadota bacterium]